MESKIVKLSDGTYIELDTKDLGSQEISSLGETINGKLLDLNQLFLKVSVPILESWKKIKSDLALEKAEVEFGVSFSAEGNIYITKLSSSSNLKFKLILLPKSNGAKSKRR